ncbi:prenyltransferase/squalene oxidase repeat-containing protein [Actinosynnema mirum]|uniref:LPXTG-motif cell wall anchor domain protein n=1 Tax=Actinosynnema mirum (strain ATCC 29888 / DSM 43827 / JCM 3225 / NBRC 14064 / NCIMB 13271 / NRRL B-12336 / IMRU 3971 / 101) TaxID=446462 RepID=C6WJL0_ACTMD|nr:prenyltransferase/squalene oxidase repeat-containing protein [Actinosynnema mirum]ACU36235.1 LPXTG-motif cell wall anchor domain protein [Actinosynnema mirum DSM 43827]
MRHGRAAAGIAALIVTGLLAPALPAQAEPTTSPGGAAGGWLSRQLVGGDHLETTFDGVAYPDHGLTADAVLAFAAAGVGRDSGARATAWLAKPENLPQYLGDGTTESYAGAHAKVALLAQVQGVDPAAFGGVDLITRLLARQAPSGRFSDQSQFGDFSNGITQSLAVIALERHGSAPQAAVDYLVGQACAGGGFPQKLEQATCEPDVDTTGYAVQALLAAGKSTEAGKALDWLTSAQDANGGFADLSPAPKPNANSTGLAAQALRVGGRAAAADKAVAFLTGLQVACSGVEANRGAIAYDSTGFDASTATRATAQAVLGVAGVGLTTLKTSDNADAPTLKCDAQPPTTTTGPTTTTTTSTTAPTTTSNASTPAATAPTTTTSPAAVVVTGRQTVALANTGANIAPVLAIGALMLVSGALALVVSRRRTR